MKALFLAVLIAAAAHADVEDRRVETKTFAGVHLLIADNIDGSIEATGYAGNDVQVDVTRVVHAESAERLDAANREVKVDMQQSGDTLKLYVDGPFRCDCGDRRDRGHTGYKVSYDFKLRVPASARVDLYTVNHGKIAVHGVTGDFDLSNVNGAIEMTGAAGSGRVHTVNGPVKVEFASNPKGASSFETLNGNVDVAFRNGLSANARMYTMHGGLYTDYEVGGLPVQTQGPERRDGKFVFKRGDSTDVKIGNGGVELTLKTLNGDIFIRNQEKR